MINRQIVYRISPFLFSLLFISWLSCKKENPINEIDENKVNENTWVFLMAGQSNMAGRGAIEAQDLVTNERILTIDSDDNWIVAKEPLHFYESGRGLDCGMSFAQEMLQNIPDSITILMVPCAVGGSSVFQWLNNEEHRGVMLFSNFNKKVQLSKQKGVIKAVLWHQGERNTNETDLPEYEEALLNLFSKFRMSVGNSELPIIMGELGRFAKPEEKAAYFDSINQIIGAVADEQDNLYFVSSEGLEHKGDNLHFNSEAQREQGKRYAQKMLEVQSNK